MLYVNEVGELVALEEFLFLGGFRLDALCCSFMRHANLSSLKREFAGLTPSDTCNKTIQQSLDEPAFLTPFSTFPNMFTCSPRPLFLRFPTLFNGQTLVIRNCLNK
ncbi:hypothetical protein PIB30_003388 [Stylosanthes scabra]|uniref:Uncharacterized protein n=1 Tax=Stylosanthes scabra TaxID=79078 RepID=A0ABU6U205_9FABA|nr:hypothetical protein [Stylosanthes scabra]